MQAREESNQPFTWPPRPVSADADAIALERSVAIARREAARPTTRDAIPRQPLSWWATVERTFLGVTHGTWEQRTNEAAWAPDLENAYCHRCGQTVGMFAEKPGEGDFAGSCAACARAALPWQRVVRMGAYTGVLREGLLEVKFSAWRRLGEDMGTQFGTVLVDALRDHAIEPSQALIVPIPTSTWRRMTRGIDHTLTIARAASIVSGIPLAPILQRLHRPPQTGRTLDQRRRNVVKTMSVRTLDAGPDAILGRTLILIDDVMTSGATMREACRAISDWQRDGAAHRKGAAQSPHWSVWACPLAVTNALDDDGRAGHLRA